MRERVRLLDGAMTVESRRGRGTTILVELPIRGAKA
jgi:signal transduction histidine kinase